MPSQDEDKWNEYRKKYGSTPEYKKNAYQKMSDGAVGKKKRSPWLDLDSAIEKEDLLKDSEKKESGY